MSVGLTSFVNGRAPYISFDELVNYISREPEILRKYRKTQAACQQPLSLRLCGGGEQTLNNGTSGWGSPPASGSIGNKLIFYIKLPNCAKK